MAFFGLSPAVVYPLLVVGYLAIMSTIKERLCEQCRRITLSKICETEEGKRSKHMKNKLVCTFDPNSGCPLCKLMAKSAVVNHENAEAEARKRLSVNLYKSSNNPNELSMYVHCRSLPNFEVRIFADKGMLARVVVSSIADSACRECGCAAYIGSSNRRSRVRRDPYNYRGVGE